MANNILEQLDDLYSRWSILDKVGKEMQLKRMWNQMTSAYNNILLVYLSEANYANQISQMLMTLQNQKMKIDQDLANEMLKHLAKMMSK